MAYHFTNGIADQQGKRNFGGGRLWMMGGGRRHNGVWKGLPQKSKAKQCVKKTMGRASPIDTKKIIRQIWTGKKSGGGIFEKP